MDLQKRLIGESLRKKILDESHEEEDEEKELKRRATTLGASPAKLLLRTDTCKCGIHRQALSCTDFWQTKEE